MGAMLKFFQCGVLASFLLAAGAAPVLAETYFLAGQAHPRFHLEIAVNGVHLKSIKPNPSKPRIFIKQVRAGLIKRAGNSLSVTYRVLSEQVGGNAPVPSFRVRLVRKDRIDDRSKGKIMAELRGPPKPYRRNFSPTTVRKAFVAD